MLGELREIMRVFVGEAADAVEPEARLFTDLGLKSMDLVNMVGMIEDTFDVEIPDEALRNFATVRDVIDYLEAHIEA